MLSEISQSQEGKYSLVPLIFIVVRLIETENTVIPSRDWSMVEVECCCSWV